MKFYEANHIESDDAEDLLPIIESSFGITFSGNELIHITNFGELCDLITNKIQQEHSDGCTSQQAFYKLREAISFVLKIDKNAISTESRLSELLPAENRRINVYKLEENLGVKLNILEPPQWLGGTLGFLFLLSLVGIFFNWQIGLPVLLFSVAGLWIATKYGNELVVSTVGEMAKSLSQTNYLKSRRDPKTFNKNEIENVLRGLFISYLELDETKLTRDSRFI